MQISLTNVTYVTLQLPFHCSG